MEERTDYIKENAHYLIAAGILMAASFCVTSTITGYYLCMFAVCLGYFLAYIYSGSFSIDN
ncbi:MAG: hypothetical protein M0R51_14130 [Clostridia bacterium]|jgi:hypothetical protein|nr:hypothetical protein [Clostridia bacterium]